jgi:hypothetical protein
MKEDCGSIWIYYKRKKSKIGQNVHFLKIPFSPKYFRETGTGMGIGNEREGNSHGNSRKFPLTGKFPEAEKTGKRERDSRKFPREFPSRRSLQTIQSI